MNEILKIGKLTFGREYRTTNELEITAEVKQYSSYGGGYTEDVYFFLTAEEVAKLRDYLNRLLDNQTQE